MSPHTGRNRRHSPINLNALIDRLQQRHDNNRTNRLETQLSRARREEEEAAAAQTRRRSSATRSTT